MGKKNIVSPSEGVVCEPKVLAKEKEGVRRRLFEHAKDLEQTRLATLNVLEDLQVEKEALARAKAKDEAILSSIGDGIIAINSGGIIIVMNKKAEELLGWNINEAIGKLYSDVVFLEDENGIFVPPEESLLAKALAFSTTTTTTTTKLYLLSKNKIKFPVAITVSPIILDSKIIGAVEVFRDITQEQAVDKAKTEFVSLASHQLRTPLSTINWYVEMLLSLDVGMLTSKQRQYTQEVYHASQRMVNLVNALLNVSRLELGTFAVEPKLTNIRKIAKTCLAELAPQIAKKKLVVKQKYDRSVSRVRVDPKLLAIIFQNFFSNSVKYTPNKGKISLVITKEKGAMQIKISDNGIGIPIAQQKEIFEKLFRADNAKKIDPDGSGLGLYIVKEIIHYTGGKVWFKSAEGKGTTFYASLPLSGMPKKPGSKKLV